MELSTYNHLPNSFGSTMLILQDIINDRLSSDWRKVWVQGNNKGTATLLLTFFDNSGEYRMETLHMGNVRNIRIDGDHRVEVRALEDIVEIIMEKLPMYFVN